MSLRTCVGCSTQYADGLDVCPHCGSTEYEQEGAVVSGRRLPLLVSVSCDCGRGPWQLRLPLVMTGLVQIPELHCASCGRQVQVPWPPVEDEMSPKITVHGGATNAREQAESSPDASVSQPLDGAEAVQGHPTSFDVPADEPEADDESGDDAQPEPEADPYAGMTLAELREAADARGVASYGSKAQIADRLRAADAGE